MPAVPYSDTVVLVTRNGLGEAEPALQQKLAAAYFKLMAENDILPAAICFYGDGVRLAVAGSPVLAELQSLESRGVRLILCSTCLNYYQIADQIQAGIIGGMTDILEAQFQAGKVISV